MWPEARSFLYIYPGPGTRELEAASLAGSREFYSVSVRVCSV